MKQSVLTELDQVAQDTVLVFALSPLPVFTITLFISSLVTLSMSMSARLCVLVHVVYMAHRGQKFNVISG